MNKQTYKVRFYNTQDSVQTIEVEATSPRDALVDSWLNHKDNQMPIDVETVD